jgi:triacylglycerol lipase
MRAGSAGGRREPQDKGGAVGPRLFRVVAGLVAAAGFAFGAIPGGSGVVGAASTQNPSFPVPYTFIANDVAAAQGPYAPPPGANNWSCRPSAVHPFPVVLVHGLFANETDNWQTYGPLLADSGYCVFSFTYGNLASEPAPLDYLGGLPPMEQSAKVLGNFVDWVLAVTHTPKVDIVGDSEGSTMPYWYLKFDGGAAKVDKMVGLTPLVHGSNVFGSPLLDALLTDFGQPQAEARLLAPYCGACEEFDPASTFIQELDQGGIAVPGVTYTQIMTEDDELVVPYTSGMVIAPNSTNIVVQNQCPLDAVDHVAMASDPVAAQDVLNALDPLHARPVICLPVLPVIG